MWFLGFDVEGPHLFSPCITVPSTPSPTHPKKNNPPANQLCASICKHIAIRVRSACAGGGHMSCHPPLHALSGTFAKTVVKASDKEDDPNYRYGQGDHEYAAMAGLQHPHIVRVWGYWRFDEPAWGTKGHDCTQHSFFAKSVACAC